MLDEEQKNHGDKTWPQMDQDFIVCVPANDDSSAEDNGEASQSRGGDSRPSIYIANLHKLWDHRSKVLKTFLD